LVMNHLIYIHLYMFSPHKVFFLHFPSLYICEYVCVRLCAYISFPSRLCLHHNY
jgi:hypothetical protein